MLRPGADNHRPKTDMVAHHHFLKMAGPHKRPGLVQQGGVATEHKRVTSVETCTGRCGGSRGTTSRKSLQSPGYQGCERAFPFPRPRQSNRSSLGRMRNCPSKLCLPIGGRGEWMVAAPVSGLGQLAPTASPYCGFSRTQIQTTSPRRHSRGVGRFPRTLQIEAAIMPIATGPKRKSVPKSNP